MADNSEIVLKVTANTKPAEQSIDSFGDSLGAKIIVLNQSFELIGKSINAVGAAFNKAIDLAKAGEEINAIGLRFANLAEQAGIVPEKLEQGISRAIDGTVDMESAMKAATGSIITLGENGDRIPQIFELARKASLQFGGDTVEQFNRISLAISSANTKSLRDIGLRVDADRVLKEYARTVNTTADNLSEAQKQQAIMNAVLERGAEKFKNVNDSATPLTESIKRQGVAWHELGDTVALIINNVFGEALNNATKNTTNFLDILNIKMKEIFLGQAAEGADKIKLLTDNLKTLNEQMARLSAPGMFNQEAQIASVQAQIDKTQEQLVIEQSLEFQRATNGAVQQARFDAAADKQKEAFALHEVEMENLRDAQTQYEKSGNSFANFKSGFVMGLKEMGQGTMALGKQIASTFASGMTNAFASVGKALVKGQNAFQAFGAAILTMLGNIAIQMGTFYMAAGLAAMFLNPGQGAGMIAAGAALGVLGGVLLALGGGSEAGGGSSAGAASAGGSGSQQEMTNMNGLTKEEERAKAQTGVQVVIQGNVFDTRETGLHIAQIINDSFDLNGTIIRANA